MIKIRISAILFSAVVSNLNAYDTQTHNEISNEALELSSLDLDPRVLSSLGMNSNTEFPQLPSVVPVDPYGSDPNNTIFLENTSINRILTGGAVLEDASTRSVHHFFDPQNGVVGGAAGLPSLVWGLESTQLNGMQTEFSLPNQLFSYRDALEHFYLALTSPDNNSRRQNFGLMFRSLGHVIHHLQDMAQPQHVRSDQHCNALTDFPSFAFFCFLTGKHNPSYYERYTNERIEDALLSQLDLNLNLPNFTKAGDYWDNKNSGGIAQFTSRNFVSDGTNFQSGDNGLLAPHPDFPNPVPLDQLITVSLEDLLSEDTKLSNAQKKSLLQHLGCHSDPCLLDFIQNEIVTVNNGEASLNPRSSTLSIFDAEIRSRNLQITNTFLSSYVTRRITSLNRFNFEAAFPYLLPRAVSYSTGLINHFFRGRLQVEKSEWIHTSKLKVTLRNISGSGNSFNDGIFEAHYDTGSDIRVPLEQLEVIEGNLPLDPGETITVTASVPDDLNKSLADPLIIVFNAINGAIGNEFGIASVRVEQPPLGRVISVTQVDICPGKIASAIIRFDEQPENAGQVTIVSRSSHSLYDFIGVPQGVLTENSSVLGIHGPEGGVYKYLVLYDPARLNLFRELGTDNLAAFCAIPFAGFWEPGEEVVPIPSHPDIPEFPPPIP